MSSEMKIFLLKRFSKTLEHLRLVFFPDLFLFQLYDLKLICMHSGAGYNGGYVNPEAGYATNAYHASYGMNPMNPMNPVSFCF